MPMHSGFKFKMEEVCIPVIINCPSDISQLNEIKKEFFSTSNLYSELLDLAAGTREDTSIQLLNSRIKSEALDMKLDINGDNDDIYIKLEPLVGDEMHVKNEIGESPMDQRKEKSTEDQHFHYDLCSSKFTSKRKFQQHLKNHTKAKPFQDNMGDYKCRTQNGGPFHCSTSDYGSVRTGRLRDLNGGNDIHIKIEQPVSEELHLKNEIDPIDQTQETSNEDQHFECELNNSKFTCKRTLQQHLYNHTKAIPSQPNIADYKYSVGNGTLQHMNSPTGRARFYCAICGYGCAQKGNLQQHMRTHSGEKPFNCSVCDYKCKQKSHLQQHMRIHTGEKPFKCSLCNYRCRQSSHLQRHMLKHTGEKPFECSTQKGGPFNCNTSDDGSVQKGRLRDLNGGNDHIYIKMEQLVSEELHITNEIDPSLTDQIQETSNEDQHFECDLSNSKFTCKRKLQQHMYNHTEAKPSQPDIADYKYSVRNGTLRHVNTHTGRARFNCTVCGYGCSQKCSLQQHMRIHSGEKPFNCSVCNYRCKQKSHLQQHMRIHTGEKPFNCSLCNYRCTQRSHLQQHMLKHTGEKPFNCSLCNYRCTQKSHLQQHMLNHTGGFRMIDF